MTHSHKQAKTCTTAKQKKKVINWSIMCLSLCGDDIPLETDGYMYYLYHQILHLSCATANENILT